MTMVFGFIPAVAALRFRPNGSAKPSPNFMLLSHDVILPVDNLLLQRLPYYGDEFHKEMLYEIIVFTQTFTEILRQHANAEMT